MPTRTTTTDPDIEQLGRHLACWRKTHHAPSPIPASLWRRASELAARLGVCRTARALKLDYGALKRRVSALPSGQGSGFGEIVPKPRTEPPAAFLEWVAPQATTIAECTLAVESATGAKLRVEMKLVPSSSVAAIIGEFLK